MKFLLILPMCDRETLYTHTLMVSKKRETIWKQKDFHHFVLTVAAQNATWFDFCNFLFIFFTHKRSDKRGTKPLQTSRFVDAALWFPQPPFKFVSKATGSNDSVERQPSNMWLQPFLLLLLHITLGLAVSAPVSLQPDKCCCRAADGSHFLLKKKKKKSQ